MNEIRLIYKAAVDAVKPAALVTRAVQCSNNVVRIQENVEYEINHNCHIIGILLTHVKVFKFTIWDLGFGKAVLGMALRMDEILGKHIKKGILSIPHGVVSQYDLSSQFLSRYNIYEGAVNNIPDEDSLRATSEIMDMVSNLDEHDILFILISGITFPHFYRQLFLASVKPLQFYRRRICIVGLSSCQFISRRQTENNPTFVEKWSDHSGSKFRAKETFSNQRWETCTTFLSRNDHFFDPLRCYWQPAGCDC